MPKLVITPALLCKTKTELLRRLRLVEPFVERVQIDIMDGSFVKNTTLQPEELRGVQTRAKLEFHCMVRNPVDYIERIRILPKPWMVIVHRESCKREEELYYLVKHLHHHGMRAGVAVNPETPVSSIANAARAADLALVMTVNPGWSGQEFITQTLPKIRKLRAMLPNTDIEVDGGIDPQTATLATRAGASVLVAGSSIFNATDPKNAIDKLIEAGMKGRAQ